ncbi:MAG: hypothetical protein Q4F80_06935, partial [bacterium]|nr:hypothetical protein [bacterium]
MPKINGGEIHSIKKDDIKKNKSDDLKAEKNIRDDKEVCSSEASLAQRSRFLAAQPIKTPLPPPPSYYAIDCDSDCDTDIDCDADIDCDCDCDIDDIDTVDVDTLTPANETAAPKKFEGDLLRAFPELSVSSVADTITSLTETFEDLSPQDYSSARRAAEKSFDDFISEDPTPAEIMNRFIASHIMYSEILADGRGLGKKGVFAQEQADIALNYILNNGGNEFLSDGLSRIRKEADNYSAERTASDIIKGCRPFEDILLTNYFSYAAMAQHLNDVG